MELAEILKFIRTNTDWLYVVIYQNKLFFFDYWTFVHFFSGLILPVILFNLRIQKVFLVSIILLILYEILEISLIFLAFNIFRPETIKDQITDILVGIFGLISTMKLKYWSSSGKITSKVLSTIAKFIVATAIAFLWVGFYGYEYNVSVLNNNGLNLWAFGLWFTAMFFICLLFEYLKTRFDNKLVLFSVLYIIYSIGLLIVEFLGYYVFDIHEVSKNISYPLILNLIHGTKVLHYFYISVPLIVILFYRLIESTLQLYLSQFQVEKLDIPNDRLSLSDLLN